ncbi:MAG: GatB/YqeY domain-containing protein [Candidatus Zapsychrus exili]|nr:GatB/YqeY domain-containing protein [Candidatus Zapsychrus exili]
MIEERISKDYVDAMKQRDSLRSSTLNFLRAQIKNVLIDKKAEKLEDVDVIVVIKKQIKQRQDSISQFKDANRDDLVEKETKELNILKTYLPEELPEEEIKTLVTEAIEEVGASSMKDMGRVMKIIAEKVQGRADNKLVSELVKKGILGNN